MWKLSNTLAVEAWARVVKHRTAFSVFRVCFLLNKCDVVPQTSLRATIIYPQGYWRSRCKTEGRSQSVPPIHQRLLSKDIDHRRTPTQQTKKTEAKRRRRNDCVRGDRRYAQVLQQDRHAHAVAYHDGKMIIKTAIKRSGMQTKQVRLMVVALMHF